MDAEEQKMLDELLIHPKCKGYMETYDEASVHRFLESYVSTKKRVLAFAKDWRKNEYSNQRYFLSSAEDHYWSIVQKKLFDLQCLWRAEKIKLPIIISSDFYFWGENIKTCPFVEPVTDKEIDCMIDYLAKTGYEYMDNVSNWQEYDEFQDESGIGPGDYYPNWYTAYDDYFGINLFSTLPDIRGKKENRYTDAWRADWKDLTPDRKPIFWPDKEEFIREVEPKRFLNFYQLYKEDDGQDFLSERIEIISDILMAEPVPVRIVEGIFPDALFQSLHLLEMEKMKTLIPQVHFSHLERISMGLAYSGSEKTLDGYWLSNEIKPHILEGRRLLGEPENFDF